MNIWEISNELGLKKVVDVHCKEGYYYGGVLGTGKFDTLHDYNTGLLAIKFKNSINEDFPSVIITTIDDGVWQGYGKQIADVEIMANDFYSNFGLVLPTEKELNEFLNKYGIFGTYTG